MLVAAPRLGHADDKGNARTIAAEAIALAKAGAKSSDVSKIAGAVAKFKQAFALDPDPEYRCGIGIAYRMMNKLARAHLFFGRCVARVAEAKRKAELRRVIESVETKLRASGHVAVDVVARPAGATVRVSHFERDETFPAPWQIWLPVGTHTLEISAPGHQTKTHPVVIRSGASTVSAKVSLDKAEVPVVEKPNPVPKPAVVDEPRPVPEGPEGARPSKRTPTVLLGLGGALALVGATFHVLAWRNIGDLDGLSGDPRADKVSTIETQRAIAVGGYVVGAISAGVGAYLLVRAGKKKRSSSLSVGPVRGGGSMVWLTLQR